MALIWMQTVWMTGFHFEASVLHQCMERFVAALVGHALASRLSFAFLSTSLYHCLLPTICMELYVPHGWVLCSLIFTKSIQGDAGLKPSCSVSLVST